MRVLLLWFALVACATGKRFAQKRADLEEGMGCAELATHPCFQNTRPPSEIISCAKLCVVKQNWEALIPSHTKAKKLYQAAMAKSFGASRIYPVYPRPCVGGVFNDRECLEAMATFFAKEGACAEECTRSPPEKDEMRLPREPRHSSARSRPEAPKHRPEAPKHRPEAPKHRPEPPPNSRTEHPEFKEDPDRPQHTHTPHDEPRRPGTSAGPSFAERQRAKRAAQNNPSLSPEQLKRKELCPEMTQAEMLSAMAVCSLPVANAGEVEISCCNLATCLAPYAGSDRQVPMTWELARMWSFYQALGFDTKGLHVPSGQRFQNDDVTKRGDFVSDETRAFFATHQKPIRLISRALLVALSADKLHGVLSDESPLAQLSPEKFTRKEQLVQLGGCVQTRLNRITELVAELR